MVPTQSADSQNPEGTPHAGLEHKHAEVARPSGSALSPGHAAVVTHPAVLLLVVAAAGLAGEHATVQTLALAAHQELEGLQAADAERVGRSALRAQQLPLRVLLLDLGLQLTETRGTSGGVLLFWSRRRLTIINQKKGCLAAQHKSAPAFLCSTSSLFELWEV